MSMSFSKFRSIAGNYMSLGRLPPIVVFESDDWGSQRTHDAASLGRLSNMGFAMDKSVYAFDCIESLGDINALEGVLTENISRSGSVPKFTVNFVMANPDFQAIDATDRTAYRYTPYYDEQRLFDGPALAGAWAKAIRRGVFVPQLHCREHVKWWAWMADLAKPDTDASRTFGMNMFGVPQACSPTQTSYFKPIYVDEAFTRDHPDAFIQTIAEGARLFADHFGFWSQTTIAPVAFWNDWSEDIWHDHGIRGIQSPWVQSREVNGEVSETPHFLGKSNCHGQRYLIRNCTFEPRKASLGVDRAISDIKRAFRFGKPAIVSTHRVNYVSGIDPDGAKVALSSLDRLLKAILNTWPDTEFLTSDALLARLIDND